MLTIDVPKRDLFDESTSTFRTIEQRTLHFEHSLKSVAEWEAKWKIPFLSDKAKTEEQAIDYIMTMCLDPVDAFDIQLLTEGDMLKIKNYIEDSMTATWFSDSKNQKHSNQVVTAEIMYYWLAALQLPIDMENWHLNRLMTQVRVVSEKNAPKKKMSKAEKMDRHRSINNARRSAGKKP